MTEYLIGADPELFLVNDTGQFISAHDIVPGSKKEPTPVLHGSVQPDGCAAEFNIHPAKSVGEFQMYIKDVLSELSSRVNSTNPDLQLVVRPTATFDAEYFSTLPRKALHLGCEPDFNAWTGKRNRRPRTTKPFRTGAGHIHIGWCDKQDTNDPSHQLDCTLMVKQLDAALYVPALLWDSDQERRELYGKMGAHRCKPYGVEYRPLSNAWVADPDLQAWVFKTAHKAATMTDDGVQIYDDETLKELLKKAYSNGEVSWMEALTYHYRLVEDHGFDPLPDYYTRMLS